MDDEKDIKMEVKEAKVNDIENKASAKEESFKLKKSTMWMGVSAILALSFIISIVTHGFSGATGGALVGEGDQFIFMNSDACTTVCDQMEPVAKEYAEKAGLKFSKSKYFQPVQVPGVILVKDGVARVSAIQDEASLVKTLCDATENEDVCGEMKAAQEEAEKEALKGAEQLCEEIPKVDKPKIEVFYESRCPFGVQAINGLVSVAKLFGDKAEINPRFMVTTNADGSVSAMHGEQELIEDRRHICLREEQHDVMWDYLKCYVETGKTEECEEPANVDSANLDDCVENRADDYLKVDSKEWSEKFRAEHIALKRSAGSPSFNLNDRAISEYKFSQNGRSPDNLKNIICCSFEEKLPECDKQLQAQNPPRGFGKLEGGTAADVEQANC